MFSPVSGKTQPSTTKRSAATRATVQWVSSSISTPSQTCRVALRPFTICRQGRRRVAVEALQGRTGEAFDDRSHGRSLKCRTHRYPLMMENMTADDGECERALGGRAPSIGLRGSAQVLVVVGVTEGVGGGATLGTRSATVPQP